MHKYTAEEVWSLRQNVGPSTSSGNGVNTTCAKTDGDRPSAGEEDDDDDLTGHQPSPADAITQLIASNPGGKSKGKGDKNTTPTSCSSPT